MHTLQKLYDSEINFSISTYWDGGFDVKLGDETNGWKAKGTVDTFNEAVDWLVLEVFVCYPYSKFTQEAKGREYVPFNDDPPTIYSTDSGWSISNRGITLEENIEDYVEAEHRLAVYV